MEMHAMQSGRKREGRRWKEKGRERDVEMQHAMGVSKDESNVANYLSNVPPFNALLCFAFIDFLPLFT